MDNSDHTDNDPPIDDKHMDNDTAMDEGHNLQILHPEENGAPGREYLQ